MRHSSIPFLALALTAHAQPRGSVAVDPRPQAVLVAHNEPTPEILWFLPGGSATAAFRVFQRRQYIGQEEVRACRTLFHQRGDSLFVLMIDTLPLPEGVYEYRLLPIDDAGREGASSHWVTVSTLDMERRPYPHSIVARGDRQERAIRLAWRVARPQRARSVRILRADTYDGPYTLLAERGPLDTVLLDPVHRVKEHLFYRVQVIDVFGPGAISVPVLALSDAEPLCLPPVLLSVKPGLDGVTLTWEPQGDDIMGYVVQRTAAGEDRWRDVSGLLFRDTITTWSDTSVPADRLHVWRVVAIGLGEKRSGPSDFIFATRASHTAPPPPEDVVARRQDRAQVLISWRPPLVSDAIIAGYHVERTKSGDDRFTPITAKPVEPGEGRFVDTTASPASAWDYRVRSVSPSTITGGPSRIARVAAEATTSAPRLLLAERTAKGVALRWPSMQRDVKALRVYRGDGLSEPKRLRELPPDAQGWLDDKPVKGVTQFYFVRAVLVDGSEGELSLPVALRW
ncbi:MAG: fibronectin type III domain-containing protein [Flavobacteriales bacterium]|nr:fibronectin type III domain-containing protein [Flavobacteriales bacterium]